MICTKCEKEIKEGDSCPYCIKTFVVRRHKECCDGSVPSAAELERQKVNNNNSELVTREKENDKG